VEADVMQATTRGAILRGTTPDPEWGEPTDTDTPAPGLADIPVSIIERSRTVYDPADATLRTVRELVGRIPGNVLVLEGDRLRDNITGEIFIIDEDERTRRSISGRASVTLALRRTGG
jgi:hypothetical protein